MKKMYIVFANEYIYRTNVSQEDLMLLWKCTHYSNAYFLEETSVRSPQKIYFFIIYKNSFRIKVSKKYFI